MGIKLSRHTYRGWSRLIVVLMVCSGVPGQAFGLGVLQQQPEKATQEKQEPKPAATPENKASEQVGDSQSRPADSSTAERLYVGANGSGDGRVILSQLNSIKPAFQPMPTSTS